MHSGARGTLRALLSAVGADAHCHACLSSSTHMGLANGTGSTSWIHVFCTLYLAAPLCSVISLIWDPGCHSCGSCGPLQFLPVSTGVLETPAHQSCSNCFRSAPSCGHHPAALAYTALITAFSIEAMSRAQTGQCLIEAFQVAVNNEGLDSPCHNAILYLVCALERCSASPQGCA
eukprot:5730732-Amphidinium_carterae.1